MIENPAKLIVEPTQDNYIAVQDYLIIMGCKVTPEPRTVTITKEKHDMLVRMADKYYKVCAFYEAEFDEEQTMPPLVPKN